MPQLLRRAHLRADGAGAARCRHPEAFIRIFMCVYIYIYACVCMCIIHTYTHLYTYIYL